MKEKKYFLNELIYEGTFKNDKYWNGKQKYYKDRYIDECYEREYLNGKKHGKGKEYFQNKKILFEGEYRNGKK